MSKDKNELSVLLGAAFLMATSAIGPAFMTQTATFTEQLGPTFGFVVLVSVILSYIAQLNIWRVIAVSEMRGQDIANKVKPGLGYVIAVIIAIGGLVFNIGNVGGAALGLNTLFNLNLNIAAAIGGGIGIIIFISKKASTAMDKMTQFLGGLMIILIAIVAFKSSPPVGTALYRTVVPETFPSMPILTLIGGTVGGYIAFSGGHRLIDAGISGEKDLPKVNRSANMGIGVAAIVRILLFFAVLGVVSNGNSLDPENPAASAFQISLGNVGYKMFGVVFTSAALTSIVGAAYTSISFLKTLFSNVNKNDRLWTIIFIAVSTLVFIIVGKPAKLLVIVGAVNGFVLPLTLGVMLVASRRKDIVGEYKHSNFLFYAGWIVVALTFVMGIITLKGLF